MTSLELFFSEDSGVFCGGVLKCPFVVAVVVGGVVEARAFQVWYVCNPGILITS